MSSILSQASQLSQCAFQAVYLKPTSEARSNTQCKLVHTLLKMIRLTALSYVGDTREKHSLILSAKLDLFGA